MDAARGTGWADDCEEVVSAGSSRRSLCTARKKPRPTSRSVDLDGVGRGCVYNNRDYNRESGFFAIAVERFFSFRADWHQEDRARPLVQHYQTALDAVLRSHPELLRCVAYCRHCGIRFLTHPRNAGRRDLRCPFGCREHHRRQCSCQRSTAYYRTNAGKAKKKRLNNHRQGKPAAASQPTPADAALPQTTSDPQAGAPPGNDALPVTAVLRLEGVVLDEASLASSPMLPHVRMLIGLIEGVVLSCGKVVRLLRQALRQHRIGAGNRSDYLRGFLHRHPP